jgi:DNA-binding MarR family transcriptional regulator
MVVISADVLRAAGQLRACLGPLVRRLRQIQAQGDLTMSQAALLARLERDGAAAPAELAAAEQIRPQSVAATLAVLQQRGLASRRPDEVDGRRVIVEITKAGRAWVQGARHEKAQRLAHAIADGFSPAEQQQLIAAIPLLERLGQII